MPGVWLGENSIPELRQSSPGIFEFGLYRDTKTRTRLLWFSVMIGFATVVAGPGIVLFFGEWYPFFLTTGFYLLWSSLALFALFKSSAYSIDTKARSLTRYRFLGSWNFQTSTWELTDDDEFTVYLSPDEHETGADHRIYLTTNGTDRYICSIHLPLAEASQDLNNWLDDLAKRLRIGNAGYESTKTYLKRRLKFRFR
jgi:hypothetical protein